MRTWNIELSAALPGRDMPEVTPKLTALIYSRLRAELRDIVCLHGRGDDMQLTALVVEDGEG